MVTNILWKFSRNPLVHSLGVLPKVGKWANVNRVQINKSDLTSSEIEDLESTTRPGWLPPTFEFSDSTFHVNVPCLYWGLHQLLRNLFSDNEQMSRVENWYAKIMPAKSKLEASFGAVRHRKKPEDFEELRRLAMEEVAQKALEEM